MSNKDFVPEMPLTWLTCPIYAEGVLLPKRNESSPDRYSDGNSNLDNRIKLIKELYPIKNTKNSNISFYSFLYFYYAFVFLTPAPSRVGGL